MEKQDLRSLRDAFGSFMTGVTVVTTLDNQELPIGFTANSFSSVSLDPPLLLICIARSSHNYLHFIQSKKFAVNILSEDQQETSNTFARRVDDRFSKVDWRLSHLGSPILSDVCAWFDCIIHEVIEAGDHSILIGRVEEFKVIQKTALGYYQGGYFTPNIMANSLNKSVDSNIVIAALFQLQDKVLLLRDNQGNFSLPTIAVKEDEIHPTLEHLIEKIGVNCNSGFIYSVYDNNADRYVIYRCLTSDMNTIQGEFVELTEKTILSVQDAAMQTMLKRFVYESRMDNYGVYFGDRHQGIVA